MSQCKILVTRLLRTGTNPEYHRAYHLPLLFRLLLNSFYRAALNAGRSEEKAVRLYVCLSVKRIHCDKTEDKSMRIFITYERSFSIVGGGDLFYLKFWVDRPPWSEITRIAPQP